MSYNDNKTRQKQQSYVWVDSAHYTSATVPYNSISSGSTPVSQSGTKVPDWLVKKAKGIDCSSAYTLQLVEYEENMESTGWSQLIGSAYMSHGQASYHVSSPVVISTVPADLDNQALTRIRNDLRKDTGYFNSYVPLGELGDLHRTISGLGHATENLLLGLVALKRGNVKDAYKRASDLWLTYSFGVKPTIQDIRDIGTSIDKRLHKQQPHARFRSHSSTTYSSHVQDVANFGIVAEGANLFVGFVDHFDLSVSYSAALAVSPKYGFDYSWLSQFGFPPENLIPAAWELVPYSWLVDYFLPIGDVLSDQFSTDGSQTIYCTRSFKCISHRKAYGNSVMRRNSFYTGGGTSSGGSTKAVYFSRTLFGSLPSRSIVLRPISSIGHNGWNKLANLTAVLGQRISR